MSVAFKLNTSAAQNFIKTSSYVYFSSIQNFYTFVKHCELQMLLQSIWKIKNKPCRISLLSLNYSFGLKIWVFSNAKFCLSYSFDKIKDERIKELQRKTIPSSGRKLLFAGKHLLDKKNVLSVIMWSECRFWMNLLCVILW